MLPTIDRILYCTRMGPNAPYIFRYALALAQKLGARITALNVMETLSPSQEALVEGYAGQGKLHEVVEREERDSETRLRKRIQAFCEREASDVDCGALVDQVVVAEGNAAEQILRYIASTGAGMVVLGAHAESSLLQALVGGTARKVVRESPVPVLLVQVPEGRQDLTMTDL